MFWHLKKNNDSYSYGTAKCEYALHECKTILQRIRPEAGITQEQLENNINDKHILEIIEDLETQAAQLMSLTHWHNENYGSLKSLNYFL